MLKYTAAAFFAVTASANISNSTMKKCKPTTQAACDAVSGCYWDASSCKAASYTSVTFTNNGDGYCADWIYPSTGTRSSGYDNVSTTPRGCMERCLRLNTDHSAFYLKGTQCGCSTSTNGPCDVTSNGDYTAYTIVPVAE